jgi:hypothetical protein
VAVIKPSGADIPNVEKKKPSEPGFNYISRNTVKFDDDISDCRDDPPEYDLDDDGVNKTGEAYLQKQKVILDK